MSRYRRVLTNELELPEIDGISFAMYPTVETRLEMLEHIKNAQTVEERDVKDKVGTVTETIRTRGNTFNFSSIVNTLTKLVYEGCFDHDKDGNRVQKKESEQETTERQIKQLLLECDVMSVFLETLVVLKIIDSTKAKELRARQEVEEKK